MNKKILTILSMLLVFGMLLVSCGSSAEPAAAEPTTAEEPAAAEEAPAAAAFASKDPTTYTMATIGEPDTLDPAIDYETAGSEISQNVYETLVFYKRDSATEFIPMLASDWTESEDGLTYTFTIRDGVTFHNGDPLTASDVAYSIQRVLLNGDTNSPSLLLSEPFLGIGIVDVSMLIDPEGGLIDSREAMQAVDAATLTSVCEQVKAAVVADDEAGTVTMTLAQPYGPFIASLGHTVASIIDQSWATEQGAWDGSCDTWQNFYATTWEDTPLAEITNGTGPFMLESWDHATQTLVLLRNDNYWRTEPLWDGAQTGNAKLERVVIQGVDEWGTRFSMLQAGDADSAVVPIANVTQVDPMVGERTDYDLSAGAFGDIYATETPDQPLRLFYAAPGLFRPDILMTEQVEAAEDGSQFTGTGNLDGGKGIPSDFFLDEHIRKAFNYCMDWETMIQDFYQGDAVRTAYSLVLPGEIGYNADDPMYEYDPDKCAEEFKASAQVDSAGNSVWDTGFHFTAVWNEGNTARQTALTILSDSLKKVNPKFEMEVLSMPWASMLHYYQARQLPMYMIGWQEDIHDPHNWYSPYLVGTYGNNFAFPDDVKAGFIDYVNRGVAATSAEARTEIYHELNQKIYDYAPIINGPVATNRHYEQRWVNGYYFNPLYGGFYYYEMSKN
jgi:peptide/nickel transport system substrate-binding protein